MLFTSRAAVERQSGDFSDIWKNLLIGVSNHLFTPVETREISVTGKEDCGIVDITKVISEEVRK